MHLWLLDAFGRNLVNADAPIDVNPGDNSSNEPEPDLIVLNRGFADFVSANPQSADISLIVEITDSSPNFDLSVKAALYARAGIIEYWVLDVAGRRLFCHRDPSGGSYRSIVIYGDNESVAPLAAPDHPVSAAQFL
jgi:Uma2 family endonuclease